MKKKPKKSTKGGAAEPPLTKAKEAAKNGQTVKMSKIAEKSIKKMPDYIKGKLLHWVECVEDQGLAETRKIPGWHDEPLKGQRAGQRSIKLNDAYRAIYTHKDNEVIVWVEEVTKHDYRAR